MTAEIVNLRRRRKEKLRGEREQEAARNRVAFGRSKADRQREEADRERARRTLESHRRGDDPEPGRE